MALRFLLRFPAFPQKEQNRSLRFPGVFEKKNSSILPIFGVTSNNYQSPPVNRGNRGNSGVCGAKARWPSQKFQPLMSRFPSGAVEFSPHLAEFSPFPAETSPCLAEFSPCLAKIFPCVAEFSPYLAECLPVWRNFGPVW